MTDPVEDLLSRTLQGRAQTVTQGPGWHGAPARRRWWPAAVSGLATAGVVVALTLALRPGSHTFNGFASSTCTAQKTAAWDRAWTSHPLQLGGDRVINTAIGPRLGDRLVATVTTETHSPEGRAPLGLAGHIVLLSPTAPPEGIYTVPQGQAAGIPEVDGRWVVITLVTSRSGRDKTVRVIAVDPVRRQTLQIASSSGTHQVGATVTSHGSVYWYDLSSRRTHRFVLETGATSVVGPTFPSHPAPGLIANASGIYWAFGTFPTTYQQLTAFALPEPVQSEKPSDPTLLHSDGSAYVWTTDRGMRWWRPGEAASHLIRNPPGQSFEANGIDGPLIVADFGGESPRVVALDLRSGATRELGGGPGQPPRANLLFFTDVVPFIALDGPSTDFPNKAWVIDTAELPVLHC